MTVRWVAIAIAVTLLAVSPLAPPADRHDLSHPPAAPLGFAERSETPLATQELSLARDSLAQHAAAPSSLGPIPGATGRTWINVTSSSTLVPPLELWANLAWDPLDGYVVLFGGCTATQCPYPSGTWTFSNGSWQNITDLSVQPPARSYAMMAYDGADGYVLLFGGAGAVTFGDTWSFHAGVWTNRTVTGPGEPAPRWGGGLAFDPQDNYVVLFGGSSASGTPVGDTWSYHAGSWTNETRGGSSPLPRDQAMMSWDDGDQEVVLMDGIAANGTLLNDTWSFQGGQWSDLSTQVGALPPARSLAMLTYDGAAQELLLFGGATFSGHLNDSWTFTNNHWNRLVLSGTLPRARGATAAMEDTISWTSRGPVTLPYLMFFGGDYNPCPTCALAGLDDTWVYEVPPSGTASSNPTTAEVGAPIRFTGAGAGGTAPYVLRWDFGDGASGAGATVVHAYASAGAYAVRLVVVDAAGAVATLPLSLTVDPGPTVSVTSTSTQSEVGVAVAFTGTVSGGLGPYNWTWEFGDGASAVGPSVSHAYAAQGSFNVTATAVDSVQGTGSLLLAVTVAARAAVAIATTSNPVAVGQVVSLAAEITGGVAPFTVAWQFGDGGTASGQVTNHSYAIPGDFLVLLRITDALDVMAQNATTLSIAPGSQPSPSPTSGSPTVVSGLLALVLVAVVVVAVAVVLARRRGDRSTPRAPPPGLAERADSGEVPPRSAAPEWDEGPDPPADHLRR